ncbi:MAG: hypothetical protein JXB88_18875 [Spirochaetales bacterium]|nr:hypothetical protein [Spirochaetales bacterium]
MMKMENKLKELKDIPQTEKGVFRRFFIDRNNDLTVWYNPEHSIIGFQLTCANNVVTYAQEKISIRTIDRCEKDNFAPILSAPPTIGINTFIDYINRQSEVLDPEIDAYIKAVLFDKSKGL